MRNGTSSSFQTIRGASYTALWIKVGETMIFGGSCVFGLKYVRLILPSAKAFYPCLFIQVCFLFHRICYCFVSIHNCPLFYEICYLFYPTLILFNPSLCFVFAIFLLFRKFSVLLNRGSCYVSHKFVFVFLKFVFCLMQTYVVISLIKFTCWCQIKKKWKKELDVRKLKLRPKLQRLFDNFISS